MAGSAGRRRSPPPAPAARGVARLHLRQGGRPAEPVPQPVGGLCSGGARRLAPRLPPATQFDLLAGLILPALLSYSRTAFFKSEYSSQGKKQSLSSTARCSFALGRSPRAR